MRKYIWWKGCNRCFGLKLGSNFIQLLLLLRLPSCIPSVCFQHKTYGNKTKWSIGRVRITLGPHYMCVCVFRHIQYWWNIEYLVISVCWTQKILEQNPYVSVYSLSCIYVRERVCVCVFVYISEVNTVTLPEGNLIATNVRIIEFYRFGSHVVNVTNCKMALNHFIHVDSSVIPSLILLCVYNFQSNQQNKRRRKLFFVLFFLIREDYEKRNSFLL